MLSRWFSVGAMTTVCLRPFSMVCNSSIFDIRIFIFSIQNFRFLTELILVCPIKCHLEPMNIIFLFCFITPNPKSVKISTNHSVLRLIELSYKLPSFVIDIVSAKKSHDIILNMWLFNSNKLHRNHCDTLPSMFNFNEYVKLQLRLIL